MPVLVPTIDDWNQLTTRVDALQSRLEALEDAGGVTPPPKPEPPPGAPQARRIADLIETFGVCTFSSMDEHNAWGSWPADYRPESVIAALKWITVDSGHAFRIREYHYEGRERTQEPWLRAIQQALPGTRVVLGVGANGQVTAVPSLVALAGEVDLGVHWTQGLNEPNTDFGSGQIGIEQTLAIQHMLYDSSPLPVLGPPIVAGMPHPGGWVRGYAGEHLAMLNRAMTKGSGHYYPPHCPDLPDDATSVRDYVVSLESAYTHDVWLTEFHPTLFNHENKRPTEPGWDGTRDAYYTLLTLLRCAELNCPLWWFALFDYGQTYICGLYPKQGAEAPRPAAKALRTLCMVTGDRGDDRRTFTPGSLAYRVENLPADGDHQLYQASDGRCFVMLYRRCPEWGGASVPVELVFARQPAEITEYDLLSGASLAVNQYRDTHAVPCNLNASVRCFVVKP